MRINNEGDGGVTVRIFGKCDCWRRQEEGAREREV